MRDEVNRCGCQNHRAGVSAPTGLDLTAGQWASGEPHVLANEPGRTSLAIQRGAYLGREDLMNRPERRDNPRTHNQHTNQSDTYTLGSCTHPQGDSNNTTVTRADMRPSTTETHERAPPEPEQPNTTKLVKRHTHLQGSDWTTRPAPLT